MSDEPEDTIAELMFRLSAAEFVVARLLAEHMLRHQNSATGETLPHRRGEGAVVAGWVKQLVEHHPELSPDEVAPAATDIMERIQAKIDRLFEQASAIAGRV